MFSVVSRYRTSKENRVGSPQVLQRWSKSTIYGSERISQQEESQTAAPLEGVINL